MPDLAAAVRAYEELGFPVRSGADNRGGGTCNAAVRSGLTYLELVGVRDPGQFQRTQEERRRRYPKLKFRTEALLAAGGGVWQFAVEVADLASVVERLRLAGLPIAEPRTGAIERPDGSRAAWGMAGLTEGPSWLPFFIQYAAPLEERLGMAPPVTWVVDHVVLETADPVDGARRLAELLDLPVLDGGVVPLPGGHIRLVQGEAERITAVVFAGAGEPRGEALGLRFAGA